MQLLNLARDRVAADAEPLRRLDLAAAREIERLANHGGLEAARERVHHVRRVLAQQACDLGAQPVLPQRVPGGRADRSGRARRRRHGRDRARRVRFRRADAQAGCLRLRLHRGLDGHHAAGRRLRRDEIGRQILDLDRLRGRHHRQPVREILELPDVARKRQRRQIGERLVGHALRLDAEVARALLQEVTREQRDVLAALAQRRQPQPDHVEPVIQILAEQPLPHARLEILMRRRDHPHVRAQRTVAAHAIELPVRQHAQQARLQIERHVADLVEKQRAVLGLLEAALARRLRARERAALVAEQLGFEQILRDRRRVQRDERAVRAWAVPVQRARDELLAGARFARDQHRRGRMRQPADRAEHVLHRGRLAEHLGRLGELVVVGHAAAQALFDRAPDQLDRLVDVERLREIFERAALKRRHRAVQIRERRHDDDGQPRQPVVHRLQQLEPRAARHPDVGHEHLRRFLVERGERVAHVREAPRREALARERLLEHPADRLVVVYYPDRLHSRSEVWRFAAPPLNGRAAAKSEIRSGPAGCPLRSSRRAAG
ncbi:hypothetical protein BURPS1710b_2767 [Burkholderia pseudomallei 1710b]|uniref:Uncharacterized protein n=1 Tax=Burkholderia pseudomallei (strain 1710b) TaxID=320372 RepID=Q3JQK1_BURP1|nr:hypothetical protein BURPS1710b_2767 [Burkholderia pseudomallei 1710b]